MIQAIFITFCLFMLAASAESAPLRLETYGETVTLESEGGTSSTLILKARGNFHPSWPEPYLAAYLERYAPRGRETERLSPALGLEWKVHPALKLFAEYRYIFQDPPSTFSRHDPRFGLVSGWWEEWPVGGRVSLLSDSYLELMAIPRISGNPALVVQSKAGPRLHLGRGFYSDAYVEAFLRESDDTNLGRRAQELRYGARGIYAGESGSLSLGAFRRFKTFRPAPAAEWRLLLTLGGGR